MEGLPLPGKLGGITRHREKGGRACRWGVQRVQRQGAGDEDVLTPGSPGAVSRGSQGRWYRQELYTGTWLGSEDRSSPFGNRNEPHAEALGVWSAQKTGVPLHPARPETARPPCLTASYALALPGSGFFPQAPAVSSARSPRSGFSAHSPRRREAVLAAPLP